MISSYFIIGHDLLPSCNDFFMWMTYASYLYTYIITNLLYLAKHEGRHNIGILLSIYKD